MNQGTTSLRHRNTIHKEQDGENQGKMIIWSGIQDLLSGTRALNMGCQYSNRI
jgi:hypothetical protein